MGSTDREILSEIQANLKGLCSEVAQIRGLMGISGGAKRREMGAAEYAQSCNIHVNTLYNRVRKGYYETPQGFSDSAYERRKWNELIFFPETADRYYTINQQNKKNQTPWILAWLFALRKRGHMKYVAKMKLYVVTW